MYVRKMRKKWQCLVRLKGVSVSQSFWSKTDARLWGQKTEVDISNGGYLKNLKLVEMRLKDLLQLYLEKALHKSKRPKILKYDVELMRRMPLANHPKTRGKIDKKFILLILKSSSSFEA